MLYALLSIVDSNVVINSIIVNSTTVDDRQWAYNSLNSTL